MKAGHEGGMKPALTGKDPAPEDQCWAPHRRRSVWSGATQTGGVSQGGGDIHLLRGTCTVPVTKPQLRALLKETPDHHTQTQACTRHLGVQLKAESSSVPLGWARDSASAPSSWWCHWSADHTVSNAALEDSLASAGHSEGQKDHCLLGLQPTRITWERWAHV